MQRKSCESTEEEIPRPVTLKKFNERAQVAEEELPQPWHTHQEGYSLEKVETTHSVVEFPESVYPDRHFEQYWFTFLVGATAITSSISMPIYFPALTVLADEFNVSIAQIDLTLTMYSVFQGISPSLWGPLSDTLGRRVVYFCCLIINIGANIGLALSPTYWWIFTLRCLQAFGCASMITLQGAVVGDITQRSSRAALMGIGMSIGQMGNCLGPILGSALMKKFGWRGIFWFLALLSFSALTTVFLLLPETNRHLVGTGEVIPKEWWARSPYQTLRRRVLGIPFAPSDPEYEECWMPASHKSSYFKWLSMIREPDVVLNLIANAILYTAWFMTLAAQSTQLVKKYGFTPEHAGYTYAAGGVGSFGASFLAGKLMQYFFNRQWDKYSSDCQKRNEPVHRSAFPIHYARLLYCVYAIFILIASLLTFGWCIQYKVTFYVPIIMTFFIAGTATYFLAATNTLLVDLFPDDAGSAISCSNLTRCLVCAAGVACVERMINGIGSGLTFTVLAIACIVALVCVLALIKCGPRMAAKRHQRELASRKIETRN